jgi:hypothetical protein
MTVEERLAVLEQRLRRAEDELAIARLMASYGPLADAREVDAVAGQGLIGGGSSHINGVAWTPNLDAAP